jgi:outer membrane receptor protein involved in Fe transport
VPGALLRDQLGGSTRVTISIRGAGATTDNGARGVRLFVDGIPKNNAGGSAQDFINIDLSAAESIEVLRGPSSALYGNQAGGVVSITSESGGPRPGFAVSQVLGSYGYGRTHLAGGGQARGGRFSYFGTAFKNVFDGFRVDSQQDGGGFSGKFGMTIDDRSTLSIVTGYDNQTQQSRCNRARRRTKVVRHACPVDHRPRLPEHAYQERKLPPRRLSAYSSDVCGDRRVSHDCRPVCARGRPTGWTGCRQRRATVRPHHGRD